MLDFKPPLNHFAILTTGKKSTDTDEKVRLLNDQHANSGLFAVEIIYWSDICLFLELPEFEHVAMLLLPSSIYAQLKSLETENASLRQTQSQLIESISSISSTPSNDAELDLAEGHIKARDPERARFALDQIKQRHGERLTPRQRFRLFIGYANLDLMEGRHVQSGELLLKAHSIFPESERSQINEVLGYELAGEKDRAYALANERLKLYPSAKTLIACRIRTAPERSATCRFRGRAYT